MYYHKQPLAEGPLGLPQEALKRALAETLKNSFVSTFAWTASELLLLSVLASNTAFAPVAQLVVHARTARCKSPRPATCGASVQSGSAESSVISAR